MGRSIIAVIAGFLVVVMLSIGLDEIMRRIGLFPAADKPMLDSRLFLIATFYRTLAAVFGCWLAAMLAPARPMRSALTVGGIGLVLSLIGALMVKEPGPGWYPWALVVTTMPAAWLGGKLVRSKG